MTWKEFKEQVEAQGVKNVDELSWIDISFDLNAKVAVELTPLSSGVNRVEISEEYN
jgi:hypothetical protein